jgi:beta-mannanase
MGLGAGGQLGIASADIITIKTESQIQTKAKQGTFIVDDYAINLRGQTTNGIALYSYSATVGIYGKELIKVATDEKFISKTNQGTQLENAALIPPAGTTLPPIPSGDP